MIETTLLRLLNSRLRPKRKFTAKNGNTARAVLPTSVPSWLTPLNAQWIWLKKREHPTGWQLYLLMRMASPYIKVHFVMLSLLGTVGYHLYYIPSTCTCGKSFTVEHALSCPLGGFPSIRHNEIRDLTVNLMAEVCHNVSIEPHLHISRNEWSPKLEKLYSCIFLNELYSAT